MDISNSFLKNLYKMESGKLLLDFSDSKRAKYINIIMNTKSYMNIIKIMFILDLEFCFMKILV